MNNFYGNYAANAIFRNQPDYTYFDKRIRQDNPLCVTLNELDDYFLKPKYLLDQSKYVTANMIDPRTKQPPPDLIVNHGLHAKPPIFSSIIASSINFEKHSWGVQIIHSLQVGEPIVGEDFHKLNDLNRERQAERNQFLKFSYNHYLKNKKQLIALTKPLYALYNTWYTNRKTSLKEMYVNESYNTLLGLPHTKICKSVFGGGKVYINKPVEVAREGFLWKQLPEEKISFSITKHNLNSFLQEYINSEKVLDKLETNLKLKFLKDVKSSLITYPNFYIPLESLLFLLAAGEYNDLPTEMFLEIKEEFSANKTDLQKLIIMDEPLPARICGWHTYKKIIENITMAASWNNNDVKLQHSVPVTSDVKLSETSIQLNDTVIEYKPLDLNSYSAKFGFGVIEGKAKFTKVLCNWCLKLEDEDIMGIYTSANILGEAAADHQQQMNLYSIKMEYKSAMGCEIMTKYELLREWLHLKLLNVSRNTCYRLDINDCNLLAKEVLTLERIEEIMFNMYQINSSQIFSNLNEFLKLLLNMPTGKYILRYNCKFPDKFMLCQPSQEITQNTIYLHGIIDDNPSDLLFIANNNYLPIADNICSTVHMTHNVIPCAFQPKRQKFFAEWNHFNNSENHSQEFSDRKNVLHRASVKKASILKTKQSLRKKAGNLRRKYRKRIKMAKEKPEL